MTDEQTAHVQRIADGVEDIERTVRELRSFQSLTLEKYQSPDHRQTRAAVERHFETLTAATVDVAKTICRLESVAVPNHRKNVIREVESCGVIDDDLGARLREAIAFRDVLAHSYGPIINDELVFDALQHSLDRYVAFVSAVEEYLSE